MRQILSTGLVALIVGALAGATVSAVAQSPAEPVIVPAAVSNINAHKVDGRHAVGSGASKAKRARKLVATNKYGLLPSNIIKPTWGSIKNKPAGFADGVDNVGYSSFVLVQNEFLAEGESEIVRVKLPPNVDLQFSLISKTQGGAVEVAKRWVSRYDDDKLEHSIVVKCLVGGTDTTYDVRVLAFADGVTPAALTKMLRRAKVTVKPGRAS